MKITMCKIRDGVHLVYHLHQTRQDGVKVETQRGVNVGIGAAFLLLVV
jgi:hypothetical protein